MINKPMTIGRLAKAAGVGVETVRFYQRKGLLKTPERTSGFREYSDADVRRIKFIKRIQDLGFTLKDAEEFIRLAFCTDKTRPILAKACENKIGEIEQKIIDLNRMLELLRKFSRSCGNESANGSQCNLLDCFENDWECCRN